jgi:hypothetical protein
MAWVLVLGTVFRRRNGCPIVFVVMPDDKKDYFWAKIETGSFLLGIKINTAGFRLT